MSQTIHVLTGCTAVGKTELALQWAAANDAEIVSCDSLLFYRGMDIGTAKPTSAERARVRHHLIDIREVTEPMDITLYVKASRTTVHEILGRGKQVLVTGGSGFYLKAFFAPVADNVVVPDALRNQLRQRIAKAGIEDLLNELRQLNPSGLGTLDTQNPRRVARALERCLASGRTLAQLTDDFAAQPAPFADYEVKLCELVREKSELDERVKKRVDQMLNAGLVDEVKNLITAGLKQNPSAAKAIGYRETIEFIEGAMTGSQLADAIAQNTRALVKKQRTWFKTQLPARRQVEAASARIGHLFA